MNIHELMYLAVKNVNGNHDEAYFYLGLVTKSMVWEVIYLVLKVMSEKLWSCLSMTCIDVLQARCQALSYLLWGTCARFYSLDFLPSGLAHC